MRSISGIRTVHLYLLALISGFATVALWAIAAPQPPAQAVNNCLLDGDYAFKGGYEPGSASSLNSRGTRADVWVPNGGVDCQHIVSIYTGRLNGFAEFGWVRGWSSCQSGGDDDTKYSEPTLFVWFFDSTGAFVSCNVFEGLQPPGGQYHNLRISDTNGNYFWGPWHNGNELLPNGVALDFIHGASYVGMERGEAADPGGGHWKNLREYTSGSWNVWDGHQKLGGNHGPGTYQIVSNTESQATT